MKNSPRYTLHKPAIGPKLSSNIQEMVNHLDFLETRTIFDLDLIDNGMILGTRIETFYEMDLILCLLKDLEGSVLYEGYTVTEEDIDNIRREYPMLRSLVTDGAQEPLDLDVKLGRRMDRWRDARLCLDLPISNKEKEIRIVLSYFLDVCAPERRFKLFKRRTRNVEDLFTADQLALDELWALTQRLKLRSLTPSQEDERQKLAEYVATEIRAFLIFIEWTDRLEIVCRSGKTVRAHELDEEEKTATKIVDERIAKGDWQGTRRYKFKFRPSYHAGASERAVSLPGENKNSFFPGFAQLTLQISGIFSNFFHFPA